VKVLRRKDYDHNQLQSKENGEQFSQSAILSNELGMEKVFIHHEILGSGRRASSPHRHERSDEFIYVLRGSPTAIEGTEEVHIGVGDCVTFKANSPLLHYLENRTRDDVEVLVISRRLDISDVRYTVSESVTGSKGSPPTKSSI
jgi:uncharacterized cupin superfamily protein